MTEFKPEIIEVKNEIVNQSGLNSDFIDANTQVRNIPDNSAKYYTTDLTRLASAWTGTWTITWVNDMTTWLPFIPKFVQIWAGRNSASTSFSMGTAVNDNSDLWQCIMVSGAGTTYDFTNVINSWIIANMLNSWSGEVRLNVTTAIYDTYCVITVFG